MSGTSRRTTGSDKSRTTRLTLGARQANAFLFPGFRQSFIRTEGVEVDGELASGAVINTLVAGEGPPLLLLHGHPETHACWHKVASTLARRFTVVLTDLRGYGDSSKPRGGVDHVDYSKRAMSADQVQVMRALGFDRFQVVGHDRGGRVVHSMLTDAAEFVGRAVTLDVAPTDLMYDLAGSHFASKYFWWYFQIQDEPLPERVLGAMPDFFLRDHLDKQCKTPGAVELVAYADYLRCYGDPAYLHAICEDYRAAAGVDGRLLRAERAAGRKSSVPLLALWGGEGTVGEMFDVVGLWKQSVENVSGHGLPCGHLIPEENPKALLEALDNFLITS